MGCRGWLWPFRTLSLMWLSSQMETFTSRGGVDLWEREQHNMTAEKDEHIQREKKGEQYHPCWRRGNAPLPSSVTHSCWSSAQITLCSSDSLMQHGTGWSFAMFNMTFNKAHVVKLSSGAKLNHIPEFSRAVSVTWNSERVQASEVCSHLIGVQPSSLPDGPQRSLPR